MKIIYLISVFFGIIHLVLGQTGNPKFDPDLARNLNADEFGMKAYVLVILKTGSNQSTDKQQIQSLFEGHLQNINQLVEAGKLIVAGPLGKNKNSFRGIFILNVDSFEKANDLLYTDPAIREKLLETELYQWYGSAALPEYLESADKIWQVKP